MYLLLLLLNLLIPQEKGITLKDAWVRPGAQGMNSALYLTIENTGKDDYLLSCISDVADVIEIHETYKRDNDRMGMRHVDSLKVATGNTFLKPGGFHVMLIRLERDIAVGEKLKFTLVFSKSGKVEFEAVVKN